MVCEAEDCMNRNGLAVLRVVLNGLGNKQYVLSLLYHFVNACMLPPNALCNWSSILKRLKAAPPSNVSQYLCDTFDAGHCYRLILLLSNASSSSGRSCKRSFAVRYVIHFRSRLCLSGQVSFSSLTLTS